MKRTPYQILIHRIGFACLLLFLGLSAMAQPGPPPPMGPNNPGPPAGVMTPPPPGAPSAQPAPPPPGWGGPGFLANPPAAGWMNQGTINVMATGYDSESVLVQIPLVVQYSFNGANYNVTVLNSWNPMSQTWNYGVDSQAYQTSYYFNGFTYNYYTVLPSGTYYFNL